MFDPDQVLLEAAHLSVQKGQIQLFNGVGFRLQAGQWLQVMGPNGVGKTTLLRMLCGLISLPEKDRLNPLESQAPQASLIWRGMPVSEHLEQYHGELIYLGHALGLKEELSAVENLTVLLSLHDQAQDVLRVLSALHELGLRGKEHLPVRALSQGQRRRVGLARLVLQKAKLWVLDEPFVALDAQGIDWLVNVIHEHLRDAGALIFTSHQAVDLQAPGRVLELQA